MSNWKPIPGVVVTGKVDGPHKEILDVDTVKFLATLHRVFNATRKQLLSRRALQQSIYDNGALPDFPKETAHIRNDPTWIGAPVAPGLEDRRVEITGPVDRKMVINALNSGAYTYMADFEDSNAPSWSNNLDGQVNLRDAVRRSISFKNAQGKEYKLKDKIATLIVRPRGWHLDEAHFIVDGQPISGSLFDFGIYFFHNARESLKQGLGPYFYLPKMEHYLEARLWNDVFNLSQDYVGLPRGTIRGTVLIETITAAFQMDEIIFELRQHSSGLNCGRWDYIFSFIKKTRFNSRFILPDRNDVVMTVPFLSSYVKLLIQTCHKRSVAAIGGMSAFIPIKNDKAKNDAVIEKVVADKEREVLAGHDGTWVAHPGLVPIALEVFNKHMLGPNQYYVRRDDVNITALDLLNTSVPGKITEPGIRSNVQAMIEYCASWVAGNGCVPVNNMMEDAATAEISRAQLWSWIYHGASTADGVKITADFVDTFITEEAEKIKKTLPPKNVDLAVGYLKDQIRSSTLTDFLTSDLYTTLTAITANSAPAL